MAFEVARAYDENKNLVPLYILTDGEVPEVSPGFDAVVSSLKVVSQTTVITIVITSNSSNPTGGFVNTPQTGLAGSWNSRALRFIIDNNSQFNIKVSGNIVFNLSNAEYGIGIPNTSVSANSSATTSDVYDIGVNDNFSMNNLHVECIVSINS